MEDKELYNPQNGEVIKPQRSKKFYKDWRFYVYTLIAIMLAIVSFSSALTACAAINAGVGQKEDASYSVAQRKNAVITTDGGYSGLEFTISNVVPTTESNYVYDLYSLDVATYTPTLVDSGSGTLVSHNSAGLKDSINSIYNSSRSFLTQDRLLRYFLSYRAYSNPYGSDSSSNHQIVYLTFLETAFTSYQSNITNKQEVFLTNDLPDNLYGGSLTYNAYTIIGSSNQFYISNERTGYYLFGFPSQPQPQTLTFQDVISYYQELGYQDGYHVGDSAGYETGHSAGYNEGYASGNANGYASGYEQATQDYQTGIAFTSYGLYANAQLTLTTDEVIGNYSYMYLFKYVTSNYDEHTVYVLFTRNSSTSQYLGYVLDRNDSDDSTSAVTLGSFSAQSSLAVTITAEQDQYFELYTGFVTSFFDRGSEVIGAVWFSGGTSQTALQNYQDGYDTGYQDGMSAGYGSGYYAGYSVGEVAGINQAEPEALTNTLVAVFQQPFNQIYRFFNFNILGLNVLGLVAGLASVFIIVKVFRKLLK